MTDWKTRLTKELEPALAAPDPRPAISAYHDMPYAIFYYPPEVELELRHELCLLRTRLETKHGKRITTISLAERLQTAIGQSFAASQLFDAERRVGTAAITDTVHQIISRRVPLPDLVAAVVPAGDPLKDVFFIVRAGALFPFYRTSALLEQLMGMVNIPGVLFYPGTLEGAGGLKFMGIKDAEHNYRPRIF